MNIERAKLPWNRRYNWREWWQHEYRTHKRALFLLLIAIIVWLGFAICHWIEECYLEALEMRLAARAETAHAMQVRMSGAEKTPEDDIALNLCSKGWKEEC